MCQRSNDGRTPCRKSRVKWQPWNGRQGCDAAWHLSWPAILDISTVVTLDPYSPCCSTSDACKEQQMTKTKQSLEELDKISSISYSFRVVAKGGSQKTSKDFLSIISDHYQPHAQIIIGRPLGHFKNQFPFVTNQLFNHCVSHFVALNSTINFPIRFIYKVIINPSHKRLPFKKKAQQRAQRAKRHERIPGRPSWSSVDATWIPWRQPSAKAPRRRLGFLFFWFINWRSQTTVRSFPESWKLRGSYSSQWLGCWFPKSPTRREFVAAAVSPKLVFLHIPSWFSFWAAFCRLCRFVSQTFPALRSPFFLLR